MAERPPKAEDALRTIGEVSDALGVPQHVLRYWETRFPQLRPMQRAGRRRYYRPDDVALARRIQQLLGVEGYTVKGVQQLLAEKPPRIIAAPTVATAPSLTAIRDTLRNALAADSS